MGSVPAVGLPNNVSEFQEKQVVKRAFIQTVAKYAPKAATLIISANSAIKNEEFKRTVIIGLDQIRMEMKQLKTSMEKTLFEATFADIRTKNIVDLVQDIDKIASDLDKKTQLANFMNFTNEHSLVNMMKGVEQLILQGPMNILDITMNSDKYHRKSTLDDTQTKIDSIMRTIQLEKELDYINIVEPQDCFHKIPELVEITMEKVLNKDMDDELVEMKEKIARMKENLDAM